MNPHPRIEIKAEERDRLAYVTSEWTRCARSAVKARGRFAVALSGGRTPRKYYRSLAEDVPRSLWENTFLFLVDERHVPQDHPDSNWRMVEETLVRPLALPDRRLFPPPVHLPAEESAARYEETLRGFFENESPPVFDLLIMGLGEDGHTASLFPGNPALKTMSRWIVHAEQAGVAHPRISMTFPVINSGRCVLFIVEGQGKAQRIRDILSDRRPEFPATHVDPYPGELRWLLDDKAAGLLPPPSVDHAASSRP